VSLGGRDVRAESASFAAGSNQNNRVALTKAAAGVM
jgi:hypothetical protein